MKKIIEVKLKGMLNPDLDVLKAEKELNNLGMQGWELVSVTPNINSGTTYKQYCTFKRAL
ncbi:DUF4177 domain-containing protein [Myroides pelagicus]|uniref:DUF4177 domain-containing protein n=1 Tax=Myroides pelagicus TaxID=270914 RepID=A0A7K1GHC1_9FLAO|nr:DUF4177 domain-containing protein [Myroides pelagicus]MEC4113491.1 DUF4177 domain-containing protein [Myroides pelagicus]MTH28328.1 DUF4177 domain-containing protein [Myroides pelagicus]